MIAIIDYGMGNLRSVQKGLERVGYSAVVTRDAAAIEGAAGVVLPGVGAFGACMENLQAYGLIDTVHRVIDRGTPFLGICLGMQLLFEESEEFGPVRGLGILRGRVVRFRDQPGRQVPHMGWNQVCKEQAVPHLEGIDDGAFVYFVHSYYVVPTDPALTATSTDYGQKFTSAIYRDNVFATQYHPEKSQAVGLKILKNFGRIVAASRASIPGQETPAKC
ncbi:MAG: imidazole glycerol phosphate synthase subunit HisH [Deltaproteobacteria bacterium]|nr:imidazole glycerol phosphate synthase subunit HisH [Deltaproteobacteria bacterium]